MGDRSGGKDGGLAGRRILVAEDNAIIAMDVQMMLEDRGAEIVGPLSTVAEALAAADRDRIDAALLDIDLNGDDSLPVIDLLLQKRVPVVLITGHDIAKRLPSDYASLPVVAKPFTECGVISALENALVDGDG